MSNLRFTRLAARTALPLLTMVLTLGGIAWLSLTPRIHAATAGEKAGTVEKIKVHGVSLEGNLEGDPADRDVFVYLPPSYATQPNRRYPVVYFIHGYGATAEAYWKMMTRARYCEQADECRYGAGDDSRSSGCAHDLRRQHVFQFAHHRKLGGIHHV